VFDINIGTIQKG